MLPALLATAAAEAQERPEAPSAPQSRPVPGPESGFIGAVGRFIERSLGPVTPNPERPVEAAAQPVEAPAPESTAANSVPPTPEPPTAAKPANPLDFAKGAIDAVSKLPSSVGLPPVGLPSSVVTGRERCVVAGNGAPDCLAAAETLCKSKGYTAGNSLDIQSAQRCKAHVWLSRQPAAPSDCTTESFVTRAVCR